MLTNQPATPIPLLTALSRCTSWTDSWDFASANDLKHSSLLASLSDMPQIERRILRGRTQFRWAEKEKTT